MSLFTEEVLQTLTRRSPLQQSLIEATWGHVTTSERLQLLKALLAREELTPGWLLDLALADPAPIVRYVALQSAFLNLHDDSWPVGEGLNADDIARHQKAASDDNEIVQASARTHSGLNFRTLNEATQLERLVFIQGLSTITHLESIADWLETAIDEMPDEEIAECLLEYFALEHVKRRLARPAAQWDPHEGILAHKAMNKGWALTAKACSFTRNILSWYWPLSVSCYVADAAELARLPADVIRNLFRRANESQQIQRLAQIIVASDAYDEGLQNAAATLEPARRASEYEPSEHEVLMMTVQQLQRQVSELQNLVVEATTRKRGLFR